MCISEHGNGLLPYMYDDTQINSSCRPGFTHRLQMKPSICLDDASAWICANRLHLKTSNTEILCCATPSRRRPRLPTTAVRVGTDHNTPSTVVRDLGMYTSTAMSLRGPMQVTRLVAGCCAILRQLRTIRRSVPDPVFQSLVVLLVLSRLDNGNASLACVYLLTSIAGCNL